MHLVCSWSYWYLAYISMCFHIVGSAGISSHHPVIWLLLTLFWSLNCHIHQFLHNYINYHCQLSIRIRIFLLHTESILENARHCGASLIEYTRKTWSSYMHLTVIRTWPNLRPQKINIYTRVHRNYNIQACCTQAGPAQAASRGDGMDRWQHSSHLPLHAL